jgi:parallel beta-helix repeat protein
VSGNTEDLIHIGGSPLAISNVLVGGSAPGQGNIAAFSGRSGVRVQSDGSNIQVIGNTIRNNTRNGIYLVGNTRAEITRNRIFANGLIGIDLGENGLTVNDAGDGDSGSNELLNFPSALRAVVTGPNMLAYTFTLDAPASATGYRIEFFASSAADPSGFGEGERYLGAVDISHGGGAQTYGGTLGTLEAVSIGDFISATTTRRNADATAGITSEFSAVATADGVAALTVAMATQLFEPPPGNPFATPGNDLLLTTTVSNSGTGGTDADSIFLAIRVDPANAFFNDVTAALGGVVGFATDAPALTFTPGTDLRFSSSAAAPTAFAQCTYTPAPGYDSAVRHVCVNPKGTLPSDGPQGQFTLRLRVRIH